MNQGQRGAGTTEVAGEEAEQRGIRLAIGWWRGHSDLEGLSFKPNDFITRGSRPNSHMEQLSLGGLLKGSRFPHADFSLRWSGPVAMHFRAPASPAQAQGAGVEEPGCPRRNETPALHSSLGRFTLKLLGHETLEAFHGRVNPLEHLPARSLEREDLFLDLCLLGPSRFQHLF